MSRGDLRGRGVLGREAIERLVKKWAARCHASDGCIGDAWRGEGSRRGRRYHVDVVVEQALGVRFVGARDRGRRELRPRCAGAGSPVTRDVDPLAVREAGDVVDEQLVGDGAELAGQRRDGERRNENRPPVTVEPHQSSS
jgi:hypothetical protein